jgi:ketosteroid isomerase-like protein
MGSNVDIVKGVYEAFGKGDVPAVLGVMDDKIEWREPVSLAPTFTDQVGPQAVAENVFGKVMTLMEDYSVNPEEFIDGGDIVVTLGRYRGKGAKTGTALDARMAHIWRFGGDKVTSFEVITDTHLWREALGM